MNNTTLNYYNANAQDFVQGTVDVDFHITQDRFLAQLKEGAHGSDGAGAFGELEGLFQRWHQLEGFEEGDYA